MFLCEIGRLLMAKIGASANNLVFTKGNISLLSEKKCPGGAKIIKFTIDYKYLLHTAV